MTREKREKQFQTKYGYFSPDGKEYIITRPDTPTPWINVISNSDYGFIISQAGSGYSWKNNADLARLTIWHQDIIRDEWGKYLYVRDESDGKFWSLTWKPTCAKLEKYKVRHGFGYSELSGSHRGIEASLLMFVPPREPLEIWKLTLWNNSKKKRKLSLFSYFEWCLGNSRDTHREFQRTFIETSYDKKLNCISGKKRRLPVPTVISSGLPEWPLDGFHSVNIKPLGYEGDKAAFWGSSNIPRALEQGSLTNTVGKWYDPIGSLHVGVTLKPGEEKTIIYTLGIGSGRKASSLVKKYRNVQNVNKALQKVKNLWKKLLSGFMVEAPDSAFNLMVNYWLKYQAIAGRIWGRTSYYQPTGGYGYRDQLQDSMIFLPLKPELTKKQILLHARHQFKDGTVYHWWHPLTEQGMRTNMTDDLLWLASTTLAYLDETADVSILNEKAPYVDAPEESIYDHCNRAIEKVLTRFSPRGLPLIGDGDWNDGMSSVGSEWKGESIWLGHFLYGILTEFALICKKKRDSKRARRYAKQAKKLKNAINKHAWDGSWYIRATKDNGSPIGSSRCKEGKIFLNAQTWAVINHVAPKNRAEKAMDAAEKKLLREFGPLLYYPGYTKPDSTIGYASRYAPGMRENGAVYTHAATWMIIAECKLKRGNNAYDIFSRLCPPKRGMNPWKYRSEPYVLPGNIDGPQSPFFGRGGWTWYTGSATWLFKASSEWILGIRPKENGLLIDPCIPQKWSGFRVRRRFRGATYNIEVKNPNEVTHGVREVVLDGRPLSEPLIPVLADGKAHNIKVTMGT